MNNGANCQCLICVFKPSQDDPTRYSKVGGKHGWADFEACEIENLEAGTHLVFVKLMMKAEAQGAAMEPFVVTAYGAANYEFGEGESDRAEKVKVVKGADFRQGGNDWFDYQWAFASGCFEAVE